MTLPRRISILICTRDRPVDLRATLSSIRSVRRPASSSVELIVIDNGVREAAEGVAADASLPFDVRVFRHSVGGKSVGLNGGLERATGDVILFTDDDVRVPTDWLSTMCEPIFAGDADVVAGGVRLAGHLCRDWMTPMHRSWLASTEQLDPNARVVGANFAARRDVFKTLPGFDPNLGPGAFGFLDDDLFAEQAIDAGFRLSDGTECVVEHHPTADRLSKRSMLAAAAAHGRSAAYVMRHYHGQNFNWLPARRLKHALRGVARRFGKSVNDDYAAEWELNQAKGDAFFRQFAIERRLQRAVNHEPLLKPE